MLIPKNNNSSPFLSRHCGLQQLNMLLRMRLLNITLRHLLHHEIRIDIHILRQQPIRNTPLPSNSQRTDRWLRVNQGVDASGHVGECEFVCGLWGIS